jgi:hypothetical protein
VADTRVITDKSRRSRQDVRNDLKVFFMEKCGSMLKTSNHLLDRNFIRFALDDQDLETRVSG